MKPATFIPKETRIEVAHLIVPGEHEAWDTLKVSYEKDKKRFKFVAFVDGAGQAWYITDRDFEMLKE